MGEKEEDFFLRISHIRTQTLKEEAALAQPQSRKSHSSFPNFTVSRTVHSLQFILHDELRRSDFSSLASRAVGSKILLFRQKKLRSFFCWSETKLKISFQDMSEEGKVKFRKKKLTAPMPQLGNVIGPAIINLRVSKKCCVISSVSGCKGFYSSFKTDIEKHRDHNPSSPPSVFVPSSFFRRVSPEGRMAASSSPLHDSKRSRLHPGSSRRLTPKTRGQVEPTRDCWEPFFPVFLAVC